MVAAGQDILGTQPGTRILLFDSGSVAPLSVPIYVPQGSGVLIQCYGLPCPSKDVKDARLNILMSYYKSEQIPTWNARNQGGTGTISPVDVFPESERIAVEAVKQCGCWSLFSQQNIGILAVPGVYQLHLTNTDYLGKIFVVAYRMASSHLNLMPSDLFFGKVTGA